MAISLASLSRSVIKPPRIVIHGDPGIGKTTFGACAPAPVVIQTEDGLGTLDVPAFPLAKTYEEVMEALGALFQEGHEFSTLLIDSLDWFEPLVWDKTCRELGVQSIEQPGYGKGYVEAQRWWKQFFDGITGLRDARNMTVVMTAHSQIVRVEDPLMPTFDRHDLKLHKRAAALAEEYADIILFATMQTRMVKEAQAFQKEGRVRAVTDGTRVMHTIGQPAFLAKNRYGLTSPLPLTWDALMQSMSGQQPQANAA